jgi:penicillin-binding protein A
VVSSKRALLLPALLTSAVLLATPASFAATIGLHRVRVTDQAAYGAVAGKGDVRLTLDPRLQREAERLLARSGAPEAAIVASDVRTGRILVWASRGGRDFVAEPYAPSASLFKIVTAAALIDGGHANEGTEACWSGGDHDITPADLERRGGSACTKLGEALGKSINMVFARLAKRHLEPAELRRMAATLGFSGDIPIDVPTGAGRVDIPDDPFGMARAAAGFWNGKLSPLGALFAMQTIANGGERVRLVLRDPGVPVARVVERRALDPAVARALNRMLQVTTKRGTCVKAFRHADGSRALPGMAIAAKTGTLVGKKPARMFSWFTSFAPADKPEIAIAVMLANDITWRTKANIVGRDMLEAYFASRAAR